MKKQWRVCVYAICKNEGQFIDRWVDAMQEADHIIVLDTGSTDNSVAKLKARGVEVHEVTISPWRFDTARNMALSFVPLDIDICISSDLDEVLNPGWHDILLKSWKEETTSAQCRYIWSFNEDGSPGGVFWPTRIHTRQNFIWEHSIHEILSYKGPEPASPLLISSIEFKHYPDNQKSRANYLALLEAAVKGNPLDARDCYYLGREYMYHAKWEDCIATLKRHLSLPSATWSDERCASMRHIAKAYTQLQNIEEATSWYNKAIIEAPYLREPYVDLANLYYTLKKWSEVVRLTDLALKIKTPSTNYVNDAYSWNAFPYDIGSIAYFHLLNYDKALYYGVEALALDPTNERIKNNVILFQKHLISTLSTTLKKISN